MDVSKYSRAFLLVDFAFYVIRTGISLSAYGFRFGRVLTYFMTLCLLYSIVSEDVVENLYYSTRIFFWTLGTVVAYRLFLAGLLSEKIIRKTIIATVIIGAVFTIIFMARPETKGHQNASAYLLLWCMPLMFLIRKSWIDHSSIAIAVVAIMMTIKRGAMIGLVISSAIYGLIYYKMYMSMRAFLRLIGFFLILGIIGAYALSLNWEAVQGRFEDKSGSGRDKLYTMLVNHYLQADLTNQIFGFGINSVQRYTGQIFRGGWTGVYAHSDWVQFMYDFGIFGIILLVWLHLQFLTLIFKYYKNKHPHAPPLIMGYVIMFLINIYSGQLMYPDTIYLGLLWAISPSNNLIESSE